MKSTATEHRPQAAKQTEVSPGQPVETQQPQRGEGAYVVVQHPPPHPRRAQEILRNHPEVRQLFGRNRWGAVIVVGLVLVQTALAALLAGQPLWVILLVAVCFGAFANHALWCMVHELSHYLVCKTPALNRVLAVVANFPFVIPSTVSFCIYHLKHHRYLGDYRHDADIAPAWEAWLFEHGFLGRLTWQCLFPALQIFRTVRLEPEGIPRSWRSWLVHNFVAQILFDLAVLWFFGPWALLYLFLSVFFAIGPHPLGARWIQEHYVFRPGQETYSYYGLLNLLAVNIGYHNEHHDLPNIPWNRLPTLKRMVPEMYEPLYAHRSWTLLWLRFLFDRRLELYRVGRTRVRSEA